MPENKERLLGWRVIHTRTILLFQSFVSFLCFRLKISFNTQTGCSNTLKFRVFVSQGRKGTAVIFMHMSVFNDTQEIWLMDLLSDSLCNWQSICKPQGYPDFS